MRANQEEIEGYASEFPNTRQIKNSKERMIFDNYYQIIESFG